LEQDRNSNSIPVQNSCPTPFIHQKNEVTSLRPQNQNIVPQNNRPQVINEPKTSKQSDISGYFGAPSIKKPAEKPAQEGKKKVTQTKRGAGTASTTTSGASRIEEYMQKDKEEERIDFKKMSIEEITKHFDGKEARLGKNSGFEPAAKIDPDHIKSWVYLMSKSFREYQFNMVETCLFYNTLVCLPTGLGKTFVAANVILNYYNWFPDGKIFFLAPTRPLVNQQKAAVECLKGIDPNHILELTGSVRAKKREEHYRDKRLFFMTPQTIDNDLENKLIDPTKIVLIIFDEAHRALGKYSYTNIVKAIDQVNTGYRIVALSATPGNNEAKVQEVLENLNIARLEAKDENDSDVKPYVQSKDVKEVIIKETSSITAINELFNEILMKPIKVMNNMNMFPPGSKLIITKPVEINRTRVMQLLEEFNSKVDEYTMLIGYENRSLFYEIVGIITSLCHAKKTLHEQGVQSFIDTLENFKSNLKNKFGYPLEYKKRLLDSAEFKKLNDCVKGIKNSGENHPKLKKLMEILTTYFSEKENLEKQSRVMIFTNNRSSANEITSYLEKDERIKPSVFIGQSTNKTKGGKTINEGINQKKQFQILKKFKEYEFNTLIATCIGEEGLDIGEIDLIICYDSGFSPIRMVQRMGRTGRKRAGKVIMLLMEGQEYFKYRNSVRKSEKLKDGIKASSVSKPMKNSIVKKSNFRFYSFNPRMIPEEITPKLEFKTDISYIKASQVKEKESEDTLEEDENSMFNMISDEQSNQNTIGPVEEMDEDVDADDDDFDYDEISALLDAHEEKGKENINSGNVNPNEENWINYDLPEDSNQIGIINDLKATETTETEVVQDNNMMNIEKPAKEYKKESPNNKKNKKRKYEAFELNLADNDSGIKLVKLTTD